ncbi:hypothetical protein GVO57_04815 [Sphingomonas changnyeongensis]|uniref:Autotransporter domain-containing protein n=1 Tax=Sphingomonas changnyeongensis TaxID=2698679 RepID=A0A7Z2S913_9SPHN|nr:hypothetical protein [Sphingomonas changnyeongensis]QHL90284.1 hypothetical protein GVO57_04815 [Sphingomonas changnyeongensis]
MTRICLLVLLAAAPASAQEGAAQPRPWTAGVNGGVTRLGPDLSQSFGGVTLARSFGANTIRIGATLFSGGDQFRQLRTTTRTSLFNLSYSRQIGVVTLEAHGALGSRSFRDQAVRLRSGNTVTVGGDGDISSFGASIGASFALAERWSLSPYAFVDRSRIDVARPVLGPGGRPVAEPLVQRQSGTTGSLGLTLDRAIGPRSSLGLLAAFTATSNSAAVTRFSGTGQRLLEGVGGSDGWLEFGAVGTVGLSDGLAIDLSLVSTLGVAGGETLSGSAGIRAMF